MNTAGHVSLSKGKAMGLRKATKNRDTRSEKDPASQENNSTDANTIYQQEEGHLPPTRDAEIAKVGTRMKVSMSSSNPRRQGGKNEGRAGELVTRARDGAVRTHPHSHRHLVFTYIPSQGMRRQTFRSNK